MASQNVKSAGRALQILMYFTEAKRPLRAAEIAKRICVPLSSCVELLSTLVNQGYLSVESADRSYLPTEQVKSLGDWLRVENPLEQSAIDSARRIYREWGFPVAVSHRSGLFIRWNFTQGVTQLHAGSTIPMLRTVNGIALLSRMSEARVIDLIDAHNQRFGRQHTVSRSEIFGRIKSACDRNYASGPAPLFPGIGTVCFRLDDGRNSEELLLSVVVPLGDLAKREAFVVRTASKYLYNLSV